MHLADSTVAELKLSQTKSLGLLFKQDQSVRWELKAQVLVPW